MVTIALVAATPFTTKYLVTSDGQGGNATVTLAQLILDANTAGPGASELAPFLKKQTDVSWPLVARSPEFSIYTTVISDAADGFTTSATPQNTAPGVNSLLVAPPAVVMTAIVELRFHNTLVG